MFIFTVNDNKLHLTAITSKIPPLLLATFIMCHHIIYNNRVIENSNKGISSFGGLHWWSKKQTAG